MQLSSPNKSKLSFLSFTHMKSNPRTSLACLLCISFILLGTFVNASWSVHFRRNPQLLLSPSDSPDSPVADELSVVYERRLSTIVNGVTGASDISKWYV